MKKRRRKNHNAMPNSGTFGLNITSMTDMFTILLVFLLQSYNTSEVQIIPDKGMTLPLSNSQINPMYAIQISLSTTELKVEEKVIAKLDGKTFEEAAVDPNDANFITPLFKELERINQDEQKKKEAVDAGTSTEKLKTYILEGKILLKADSALAYDTLRKVMYTSSMAGFPKLKLATVVGE